MQLSGMIYSAKKKKRSSRVFMVVLFILIIYLTAVTGLSLGSVFSLIYPENIPVESFSTNIAPNYQDISTKIEEDSIYIKGWLFFKKEHEKVIIISHDYGKNRMQFGKDTIGIIKGFINNRFDVIIFDYRNHGDSEGKVSSLGFNEVRDLEEIVELAKKRGYRDINILGYGMGANTALELIEKRKDINSIIADSPSWSNDDYLKRQIQRVKINRVYPIRVVVPFTVKLFTGSLKKNYDHYNNINKAVPGKVMFIHGSEDIFIDKEVSKKYFTKLTENNPYNSKYLEISGAGYTDSYMVSPQEYLESIVEFLNE
jgi:pimeloyl-ACP methyl ester carboxylesterase